ncbi:MAG: recombinase family protein [Alphaproteobacteria bacterium]|nr:MAG: recombinase family protein [Alphaproteobacteria bacterium]
MEQEYNSLDAQRDSSLNYISSQRHEGWIALPDRYDDGGFSGGNMERPAIKRLFADIEQGLIDVVVVYKIDRLSRSIADFVRLMEFFEKHSVVFVSVTQSFNTQNGVGKLMLNILLSFAQFEREVTSERIRDKIAASKKKGMYMGGQVPLGYDVVDKKLKVNIVEAETIRFIYEEYYRTLSPLKVVKALRRAEGLSTKTRVYENGKTVGGKKICTKLVYDTLNNPIYIGKVRHKKEIYDGEHKAIISQELWDKVHSVMAKDSAERARVPSRTDMPAILKGILFDAQGNALTPTFTRKRGNKIYRYYVNIKAIKQGRDSCDIKTFPADETPNFVLAKIREMIVSPELLNKIYQEAKLKDGTITLDYIRDSLQDFNSVWEHLFGKEKCRIVQLIVSRIVVSTQGIQFNFYPNGLINLAAA